MWRNRGKPLNPVATSTHPHVRLSLGGGERNEEVDVGHTCRITRVVYVGDSSSGIRRALGLVQQRHSEQQRREERSGRISLGKL